MKTIYTVDATVVRIVDGDTVELIADLGWRISIGVSARLVGINAIEHNMPGGKEAKEHLASIIPLGTKVTLVSLGIDKYGGRTDARILTGDIPGGGVNIIHQMVADGYAVYWDGKGPRPLPKWPME